MDDRLDAGKIDLLDLAHIALNHGEGWMRLEEISEPLGIEGGNLMTGGQQFRDKNGAFIAAGAGDENFH